ncbi:MAG: TetR/AcrR family transcriptional regulator [Chitinophagaceae bacterium]|nr:TetR/AcrR family transcriptional regulator [Oligoflexus sp.]
MGRPKKFSREDVLSKALPLFWKRGFTNTGLQDLEKATGVNKSGLYAEFKDKGDIFLSSLQHYYKGLKIKGLLTAEPKGWGNIEAFLNAIGEGCSADQSGCFGVNSMREISILPDEAAVLIAENRAELKALLAANVAAEHTAMNPLIAAELLTIFAAGLSIEQNLRRPAAESQAQAATLLSLLKKS